jgi:ribose transport system substrate-binding protein
MTRLRAAVAVTMLTVLMAGCGGASSSNSSGSSSTSTKKVVYIPGLTGNPFYTTVACGAMSVAGKLNVNFSVQGAPQFDVAKQTAIVNAVVTTKPDAIMISHTDPKGMIAPLKQAEAAGIKVVLIDGDLADTTVGVTNIQSDNVQGGKLAAQELAKQMGNSGSVVIIDNDPGFPISEQRVQGFQEAMKANSGIKVLGVQYSHNQTANAALIVSSTAAGHPDLKGVYTVETNNTEGAITGIRESNGTGKIKLVGYDTSDPIVAALQNGSLTADVVQYPYGEGQLGLQSAVDAINGKKVAREQHQPFAIATPANVNTPEIQKYIYKTHC